MKRSFFVILLFAVLVLSSIAVFSACNNYSCADDCDCEGDIKITNNLVMLSITRHPHVLITVTSNGQPISSDNINIGDVVRFNLELDTNAIDTSHRGIAIHPSSLETRPNHNIVLRIIKNNQVVQTILNAQNQTNIYFEQELTANLSIEFGMDIITPTRITASTARQMMLDMQEQDQNFYLVDVRGLQEFIDQRIQGAIHLPVGQIGNLAPTRIPNRNSTIFIYCRNGSRSATATNTLIGLGYTNVYNFGGITAHWPGSDVADLPGDNNSPYHLYGWYNNGNGYPTLGGCHDACDKPYRCLYYWGGDECLCPPRQTTCPVCDEEIRDGFYCTCAGTMLRFGFSSHFRQQAGWHGLEIFGLFDEDGQEIDLHAINNGMIDGGNLIGHVNLEEGNIFRLRFRPLVEPYVIRVTIGDDAPLLVQEGDGYEFVEIYINPLIFGSATEFINIHIHFEYECPT